jgi:Ser/Thr protein kinase RdoA (MazF antagonist)
MRLDRLAALVATVRPDRTSALADVAASRWGLPVGAARYVRTSAAAVFATPAGYLRLLPAPEQPRAAVEAVARASAALAVAGAPVAGPRPSTAGALVETFAAGSNGLRAVLVAAAPGRYRELPDLDERDAVRWGRALARLHTAGRRVDGTGLPTWPAVVERGVATTGDRELVDAVGALVARCTAALGPPGTLVHGDPQPDNAAWSSSGPTFFDLDDACVSWPMVDLATAVRDVQPLDVIDLAATESPVGRALIRGYRQQAVLTAEEEHAAAPLQRLSAALTCARLLVATAAPTPAELDWLTALRIRLRSTADLLRTAVCTPP